MCGRTQAPRAFLRPWAYSFKAVLWARTWCADRIFERFDLGPGAIFIVGDKPVTEDQVRQKLQSEGYSNQQIVGQGRYFEAAGSKDGPTGKMAIAAETGRHRHEGVLVLSISELVLRISELAGGKQSVKMVPPFALQSTLTFPPCIVMVSITIEGAVRLTNLG